MENKMTTNDARISSAQPPILPRPRTPHASRSGASRRPRDRMGNRVVRWRRHLRHQHPVGGSGTNANTGGGGGSSSGTAGDGAELREPPAALRVPGWRATAARSWRSWWCAAGAGSGGVWRSRWSGGAGGGAACVATTGKALQFSNSVNDLMTGDLGADLPGGNASRTIELGRSSPAMPAGRARAASSSSAGEAAETRSSESTWRIARARPSASFDPYTNGCGDNDPTPVMAGPTGWHHLALRTT